MVLTHTHTETHSGSVSDAPHGAWFSQYHTDRHNKHSVCVCAHVCRCVSQFVLDRGSSAGKLCLTVCAFVSGPYRWGQPVSAAYSWWSEPHTCWSVTLRERRGDKRREWGKEWGKGVRERRSFSSSKGQFDLKLLQTLIDIKQHWKFKPGLCYITHRAHCFYWFSLNILLF